MLSKVSNIGSQLSNTINPEELEQTVVMIKPGFAKLPNIEAMITNKILSDNDIKLVDRISGRLSKQQAMEFYIDKKDKTFYDELTDYMSSDDIVAFIFESHNAISKVRVMVEELRITLKAYFNIPDDVMKNILHATNTKLVNNQISKEDMAREKKILCIIKENKRC